MMRLASTVALAGGLCAASFALADGTAQAEPHFAPAYHWCPGDEWQPGWGNNWEWGSCHDDHHRDFDAGDHSRDYWADQGGYYGGPPPWQPAPWQEPPPPPPGGWGQPPFCVPFVNCPPG